MLSTVELRGRDSHVGEFFANVLEACPRFQVQTLVLDQLAFRDDVVCAQFLCPAKTVFGHLGLRLPDQVFLDQLIELQAADGDERLALFHSITQLHVDLFHLAADAGRDLGHLLEVEGDLAGGGDLFWNGPEGGRLGAETRLHGRWRMNRGPVAGRRRSPSARGGLWRLGSLVVAGRKQPEQRGHDADRRQSSSHCCTPMVGSLCDRQS